MEVTFSAAAFIGFAIPENEGFLHDVQSKKYIDKTEVLPAGVNNSRDSKNMNLL